MASNADILLLLGVEGGGDINGASGRNIEQDIRSIVSAIENNITTKLQFRADEAALSGLVSQIETAFRNANLVVNTGAIESQINNAVNNAISRAENKSRGSSGSGTSNGTGSTTRSRDESTEINNTARAIDNLNKKEQEAYEKLLRKNEAVREYIRLSQISNRTDEESARLAAANKFIGQQTGGYRRSGNPYSSRYDGIDPNDSAAKAEITRQIIPEEFEQFLINHGMDEQLTQFRNELSRETNTTVEEIEQSTDSLIDAIERHHRDIVAAIRRNHLLPDEELLSSQYTADEHGNITQEMLSIRNNRTGQQYSSRYNVSDIDETEITLGGFQTEHAGSTVSDAKIRTFFNNINTSLDKIKHKRDQILDNEDLRLFGEGLKTGVDSAISEVEELDKAVRAAIETGAYSRFKETNFLGGKYNYVNDIPTAMRAMNNAIADSQYAMSNFNSEVKNAKKHSESLTSTLITVKTIKSQLESDKGKYITGSESQYSNTIEKLAKIEALIGDIERYENDKSGNKVWQSSVEGANNYAIALKLVEDELQDVKNLQKTLSLNSNNLSDKYKDTQVRQFIDNINLISNSKSGYYAAPDLFSNEDFNSLLNNVKVYSSALNVLANTEKHSDPKIADALHEKNKAYDSIKKHILDIIPLNERLTTATKKLTIEENRKNNVLTQTNKVYLEAARYYKDHESGIKRNISLNKQWQDLLHKIHTGSFGEDLNGMRAALSDLQVETKSAGAETLTLHAKLKKLFNDHFGSVAATTIIGAIGDVLRNAYTRILDIDKAMTELKKVTDLTTESYEKFGETAAKVAREVGGTIADTINATADYARLGFDIDEATELAKAAMIYKNVGDGIDDISEASESIISTIKGFGLEATDAMSIIDKFNEVGNNYAIDSVGIGEALKRSAAALSAANNTLDESIALATAANNVIQDPDVVGTALKTMSMFLRAAKTEAEEAGIETEGMATSISELRDEMLGLTKVDIMIDDSTFKSTYQILKEIAGVWNELTDIDQANIAERLVGKRQSNVFFSIVENFDEAESVLETALNSAGSAAKENEKFLSSIEGRIQALLISFEELSTHVLNSEVVKVVVDAITKLIDLLDYLVELKVPLGALIGTTIGSNLLQTLGIFGTVIEDDRKKVMLLGKSIETIKKDGLDFKNLISNWAFSLFGQTTKQDIEKEITALKSYAQTLSSVISSGYTPDQLKNFAFENIYGSTGILKDASSGTKEFANGLITAAQKGEDLNAVINTQIKNLEAQREATKLSTTVLKGLGTALAGTLGTILLNLAITGIAALIDHIIVTKEEAEEMRKALVDAAKESADKLKNVEDELENIRQQITEINEAKKEGLEYDDEELERLKEKEASLEAQYTWLKQIDEYNHHKMYSETQKKIVAHDRDASEYVPVDVLGESGSEKKNAVDLAQIYINSVEWYKDKIDDLFEDGLKANEFEEYTNYTLYLKEIQTELNSLMAEFSGYFDEGSIQYSEDPQSLYQIINKILKASGDNESLGSYTPYNVSPEGAAYSAYLNFETYLGKYATQIQEAIDNGLSDYDKLVKDPTKGDEEVWLLSEYAKKTFDWLSLTFLEQNPVAELNYDEFNDWKKTFESFVKEQIKGNEFLEKEFLIGDFYNNFFKHTQELAPADVQIQLLEEEFKYAPVDRAKEIQLEISKLQRSLTQDGVDLANELSKADSDYTSQLKTHIESLSSKQGELQSVYQKLQEGDALALDSDDVKELLKIYPELIEYSDTYTNTLKVPASVLEDYFNQSKSSALEGINSSKAEVEDALERLITYGDIESNEEHKEAYETLSLQLQLLESQKAYITGWSLASSSLEEYNNVLEKARALAENKGIFDKLKSAYDNGDSSLADDLISSIEGSGYNVKRELEQYVLNPSQESIKRLYTAYKKAYDEDVSTFSTYLEKKQQASEVMWDQFLTENSEWVEKFSTKYNIDLTNYSSYLDTKKALEDSYFNRLNEKSKEVSGGLGYDFLPFGVRNTLENIYGNELGKDASEILEEYFNSKSLNTPYTPTASSEEDNGSDDWFSSQQKLYEDALAEQEDFQARGLMSYEDYLSKRSELLNQYFPEGVSTESDEYRQEQFSDIDWEKLFEERMSSWEKLNNYDENDFDSISARNKEMSRLAKEMFYSAESEHHSPALYKQYIEEVAESERDVLSKLLDKGVVEYDDFLQSVTNLRNQYTDENGGFLLPIGFITEVKDPEREFESKLEAWKKRFNYNENDVLSRNNFNDYFKTVAQQIYGDSSLSSYNPAKLEELLEEASAFDDKTESLKQEQTLNFLQEAKELVEQRYEEEKEALDEINKKEQRRLDIVQARIDLENAKKNRNQLVFSEGTYYYDYDQDAIKQAEEKYQDAVKADEDAEREAQKKKELDVYDTLIDAVQQLGTEDVSALHLDTISDALMDYQEDGKLSDEKLENISDVLGKDSDMFEQMKNGTFSMSLDAIREIVNEMSTSDNNNSVLSSEEQAKTDSIINEYNNSTISNDNSVNIENITNHIRMPDGTTEQQVQAMIDGFASEVIEYIRSLATKIN